MKLGPAVPIIPAFLAGIAVWACADIAAPDRSNAYEWRLIIPGGTGAPDTLSFHWPQSRLPVKIWAEDIFGLPDHTRNGIAQWKAGFLYREFDAEMVSDSNVADVIVSSGTAVKGGFSVFRLRSASAPECEGGTDFELPEGSREIQPPIRVFVNPRIDPSLPGVDECMALTTTHELGHAIGIFQHSPVATDLMFADPTVSGPSDRDRSTAELAYHTEATLTMGVR
jgi:hypothetical protein